MEETKPKGRLYWFFRNLRNLLKDGLLAWMKKHPVIAIIAALVLLYSLFVLRASYQPALLFIRKYYLLLIVVVVVLLLFLRQVNKRNWKGKILTTTIFAIFLLLCFWLGPRTYRYLALYDHYQRLNKVELTQLPRTDHERIQPLNSIKTLINQEVLSETEDATPPRFVRGADNGYYFSSAVGPSAAYPIQRLSKHMYEAMMLPAHLPSPVSSKYKEEVDFFTGELLMFSNNAETAAQKKFNLLQLFSFEPAEILFLKNDKGEWTQVVSLIKWEGILFPRPVFGGVMVQTQDKGEVGYFERVLFGHGDYIPPKDIYKHAYLKGQNLLPSRTCRFIAECFRFRSGFFAPMPLYHEGDIRIPDLPQDQNPQPFVLFSKFDQSAGGKIYNYFGLEPYEERKKSLALSLFIPGDGEDKVFFVDNDQKRDATIGSSAVASKIVESKKNYDWSENYPAESRPFIRDIKGERRMFWLSTIVTRAGEEEGDYIGGSVPEITMTDAVTGTVIWIDQDSLSDASSWPRIIADHLQPSN